MSNPNGLTKDEWKLFSDLLLKANNDQVREMSRKLNLEQGRRFI